MASINTNIPPAPSPAGNDSPGSPTSSPNTPTTPSARPPSAFTKRFRGLSKTFEESDLPEGFLAATGSIASSVMSTPGGARRRSSATGGEVATSWLGSPTGETVTSPQEVDEHALELRQLPGTAQNSSTNERAGGGVGPSAAEGSAEQGFTEEIEKKRAEGDDDDTVTGASKSASTPAGPEAGLLLRSDTAPFDNGYHFPPAHDFKTSFRNGSHAFFKFAITPIGAVVVLYGLLVVAFGGMLFLLLCNASPAMCYPTCNDINSPRRKWIEYDSQIVNALFCVTGFGLAPWRFRDLYFLMQYRLRGNTIGLRKLAGIHRGWFRLQGSQDLPNNVGPKNIEEPVVDGAISPSVPYPLTSIPDAPFTGRRAPPTKPWKMDLMVWANCFNTFMQCLLSGFMWGLNRHTRPSWSTGLFVALAIVFAAVGGLVTFFEGKTVKRIEGVPLSEADKERLARDRELNIPHYNNIKDKKPKSEKEPGK